MRYARPSYGGQNLAGRRLLKIQQTIDKEINIWSNQTVNCKGLQASAPLAGLARRMCDVILTALLHMKPWTALSLRPYVNGCGELA